MKRALILVLSIVVFAVLGYSVLRYLKSDKNLTPFGRESEEEESGKEGKDKPEKFLEYYRAITTHIGETSSTFPEGYVMEEFLKATTRNAEKSAKAQLPWLSRGPYNVSGRVRSIIVDPDDATSSTWFVGSASGGVWKTTDAGKTWNNISGNLPNLATGSLAMAATNHSTIYAGTGEGFGGSGMVTGAGIFKTTDKGITWTLLTATSKNRDFFFVNRIMIDPADENHVIACTNTGVFRSLDGGTSWKIVYKSSNKVQDIKAEPDNFLIQYAGVNSVGVIKSTNGGETWNISSSGIGECHRVGLTISASNHNKVYACIEGPTSLTYVYLSQDRGVTWSRFKTSVTSNFVEYLGAQGWYDNTIVCHPYNDSIVFIGGVYLGSYKFSSQSQLSAPQVIRADTFQTASFLSFINFGGQFLSGGLQTGDKNNAVNLKDSDWVEVEVRYGSGISQNAHRFTVPSTSGTNGDGGAGVPAGSYIYKDYVSVPFQAWDIKHNRQLMVSFRDQERDGAFNLIQRSAASDVTGREYFFINAVAYKPLPDTSIAKNGGQAYKQLYFFWPTLATGAIWNPNTLLTSKIVINYGQIKLQLGLATIVSDGAGDQGSKNSNLHVDHHVLLPIPIDPAKGTFYLLNGNDGGLGISKDQGNTWTQLTNGFINTQFYGVDKKPGSQEYIGGMQDNGTWQSPSGKIATDTTKYSFKIGGDGFSVLWHSQNTKQIIGSVYNNKFYLSKDGGATWQTADKGINEDGPFITHIGYSDQRPDVVFAVGKNGVWKTTSFATSLITPWNKIVINAGWSLDGAVSSQHNVAVSLANPNIVWAGAGMLKNPFLALSVSLNGGTSFATASVYDSVTLGYISGLATHPTNPNEAFALFSYYGSPKILRTMDLGKSWRDISGFNKDSTSKNGFPNVMVNCLLVMPFDTTWIWAGTEIGLFESRDNGKSWAYADNGLPPVSIWQMKTRDNEVLVATHGRGIWTTQIPGSGLGFKDLSIKRFNMTVYPNPVDDNIRITFSNTYKGQVAISIYDLDGRKIYQTLTTKSGQDFDYSLAVSFLHSGTYIITVDYQNQLATAKVVKR